MTVRDVMLRDGLRAIVAAALAVVSAACGDGVGPAPLPTVASVEITPGALELSSFGETRQLGARAQDAGGATIESKTFTWASLDPTVAAVDPTTGVVTANDNGIASVTAGVDGVTGSAQITVDDPQSVGPNGNAITLGDGDVTLDFPSGAVTEGVTISATPADGIPVAGGLVLGTAFNFEPDGISFAKAVGLTLGYEPAAVGARVPESTLGVYRLNGPSWDYVAGSGVVPGGGAVSGSIGGFSVYGVRGSAVLGTWQATEYHAGADDLIAQGMTLSAVFLSSGAYALAVTGDLTDLCDGGEVDCAQSGRFAVDPITLTFDAGDPENEIVTDYDVAGDVLTISLTDGGVPVSISVSRAAPAGGLIGIWEAVSYLADGTDLISQGMTLSAVFFSSGHYSLVATGDLTDLCDEGASDCAQSGPYAATATTITFDVGSQEDELAVDYTVSGSVLTLTTFDGGLPVTLTFRRVE